MTKVATLRQRHPDRDGDALADRQTYRALYVGGRHVREIAADLLPKAPHEPSEDVAARRKAATYAAHPATVVDGLCAGLSEDAPRAVAVGGDVDEATADRLAGLTEDADGSGASLRALTTSLARDLIEQGEAWACVDAPPLDLPDGASEAEAIGALRDRGGAYIYRWDPLQVLDYALGPDGRVQWVVREYTERVRDSATSEARVDYVWEVVDEEAVTRYRWTPKEGRDEPADDDVVTTDGPILHGRDACPVVLMRADDRLWAMRRMRDPAVRAYQLGAALDWRLYRTSAAILALRLLDSGEDDTPSTPLTGEGAYLTLRIPQGDSHAAPESAEYLAPPMDGAEVLADRAEAAVRDVYKVVSAMAMAVDPSSTSQRQSADAQREQWRAIDRILVSYGEVLRDGLRVALGLWATWERIDPDTVTIEGLRAYTDVSLDRMILVVQSIYDRLPGAARRELIRGVVAKLGAEDMLPDDADRDAIEAAIQSGEADGPAPGIPTGRGSLGGPPIPAPARST